MSSNREPITIEAPAQVQGKAEVTQLVQQTRELTLIPITSASDYVAAGDRLIEAGKLKKNLEATRLEITRPLDEAKRSIMNFFSQFTTAVDTYLTQTNAAMLAYKEAERRKAAALQAEADEKARKERERLEARAQKAIESGKAEKAELLLSQAATVVAPILHTEPPKVQGMRTVESWHYEIVDASQIPREYLIPDEVSIGKVVRALKANTKISGIRVFSSETNSRTGR